MIYTIWEYPWAFYFSLFIPVLWWLRQLLFHHRAAALSTLGDPRILEEITLPRSANLYKFKTFCLSLAWLTAVIAWMNPQKLETHSQGLLNYQTLLHEVICVVDVSASMSVPDSYDSKPRLEKAKELVALLLEQLEGDEIALYALTSQATKLAPPTGDLLFLLLCLDEMTIDEGGSGTDISTSLERIVEDAKSRKRGIQRTVILFSDGGDNNPQGLEALLAKIDSWAAQGWRFFTVGIGSSAGGIIPDVLDNGTPVRSTLNRTLLKTIAERGNGLYVELNEIRILESAKRLAKAIKASKNTVEEISKDMPIYSSYFQVYAAISFLLILAVLLLPDVARRE